MASKSRKANVGRRRNRQIERLEPRTLLSAQPSVNTVTPANGATNVALNAPITATVNLPNGGLNPNTVISANVTLYPTGNNNNNADVPAVVNTSGGGDDIVLTPSVNLQVNTSYTFTITAAVQDVNNDAMTPYSETFTTGSTVPPVNQTIAFSKTALPSTQGAEITDMQMGPDGRLYASTETGQILRYGVNSDGTLGQPQVITALQTFEGGNRLISGFAFDPASTASNPIIWVSNTFYALSGATNGPNFTGKLTVMSGPDLGTVQDAIVNLPRSISDHVNDQPIFQPGTHNLFFEQAGQNAYGAPDTTWGNRAETMLSSAILEVNTSSLNLSGPALNVLTTDAGGTYSPFAAGAPLTIYADGIRNAFTLFFDSTGQLWAPANGSSSGGNTPAYTAGASGQVNGNRTDTGAPYNGPNVPALTNVQQTEEDTLFKVQQGKYYGHPNPSRGEYVLDDGNPTTGGIPGLAFTAYPSGTNPDANYAPPNYVFGVHNSPDGMIQYTGSAFGGALSGKFLVSEESAGDDIVVLSTDANDNIIGGLNSTATSPGPDRSISGFSGFNNPVTLTENNATGFIYVSELGTGKITLLKPSNVSPTIAASTTAIAFNTITTGYTGAAASRAESVTITNTGADALTFGSGAFTIVNNPASPTQNAADYAISNSSSLPTSLAMGASATVQLKYTSSATGIQSALLQIASNDPATPTLTVTLNGIGTPGQFGYNEPSLVQVLRANNIPTIVGAGPNDVNINTTTYPETPDASSQEVAMQRLVVANPAAAVTITPLASFDSTATPTLRFGYYTPGNASSTQELFTIASTDAQTVYPTALGATSFNPGTSPFGLYATFTGTTTPNGSLDVHYSEDALNTQDPSHPRKFRFFPLENPDGSVVPNAYIVAAEDYNAPTYNSFVNFVGIIRNVMPASNATAGSTPSSATANNPPVMGVVLNGTTPGSTNLIFNTIQIPNTIAPDVVHNTNTVTINNTGDQPLVINSLTLSDTTNWTLVNPPAAGTSIAAGGSLVVTIKFIASTDPPHTNDEINDTTTTIPGVSDTQAGGVWTGTLTISSNDPVNSNKTVNLAGYWQYESEHETEPNVNTLSNLLMGYQVSDTGSSATDGSEFTNNGNTPILYGSEVDPSTDQGLFLAADSSRPVGLLEAAAFHQQYATPKAQVGSTQLDLLSVTESGTTVTAETDAANGFSNGQSVTISGVGPNGYNGTYTITSIVSSTKFTYTAAANLGPTTPAPTSPQSGWYLASGGGNHYLWKDQINNGQSLLPNVIPASYSTVQTSFTPSGAFGINLDGEKSQDSANSTVDTPYNTSGHALRFWPVVDANGNTVPNTWAVGLDYRNYSGPNSDYQDLFEILTNATFEGMPATPADIQASQAATGVAVQWAPARNATGYNVYRSLNGGAFTKITSSPVTATSYTDTTAPTGNAVRYEVTGVASGVESVPATTNPISLFTAENGSVVTTPAAPANVAADGSSGTQVSLTWSASTGATSYNVERETPGSSTFVQIASGVTVTNLTDTAVIPGDTYVYRVYAQNSSGISPPSSTASATVTQPQSAPTAPTNLTADGSSGTQVVLNWTGSASASSYNVLRQGPTDTSFVQVGSGVTATTFTDTAVTQGDTYQYEVEAQNSVGTSPASAVASATVTQPVVAPAAPTGVQADGSSGTQVALTWSPTMSASTYIVLRQGPTDSTFVQIASGIVATNYSDSAVVQGSTYQYEVEAQNSAGVSPASAVASATVTVPQTAPLPPSNLEANGSSGTQVILSWNLSTGASSYVVQRKGPGDTTFSTIATALTTGTYTDTSVTPGATYQYQVQAVNSVGSSAFTTPVTAAIAQPPATLNITVGKGANKKVQFVTSDGTVTTINLSGPGTATVHFSATTVSQSTSKTGIVTVSGTGLSVADITTTGTSIGSVLNVVTKGGNGIVHIGDVSIDASLGAITGKGAVLGGSLDVTGSIGRIILNSADASSITVGGTIAKLQLATATGVTLTSSGAVKNITATAWTAGGTITAPAIGTFTVKTNATFTMNVGTVHTLKVAGTLASSTITLTAGGAVDLASLSAGEIAYSQINTVGNIGSISAGSLVNSTIFAGVGALPSGQALPATAADFTQQSGITSVTLKKGKNGPSDIDSSIAASFINKLSLANVQFSNGGTPFGVAAIDINSVTAIDPSTGKSFTFKKLTSQAIVTADLTAKAISPQDFVLQIV